MKFKTDLQKKRRISSGVAIMTEKSYDVIIIGAGPGGIFSAYELVQQNPDLKIACLSFGERGGCMLRNLQGEQRHRSRGLRRSPGNLKGQVQCTGKCDDGRARAGAFL